MPPIVLHDNEIKSLAGDFIALRTVDGNHRYESFDFCYTYFQSFKKKREISSIQNIERSCLHLSFYLASWGMLRGSSFLLGKSLRFYKQIVKLIAESPTVLWSIDANNYTTENMEELTKIYKKISNFFPENRSLTLTSKIMLGVYGNSPALDEYVTGTLRAIFPERGFRAFRPTLPYINRFYRENSSVIDSVEIRCRNFENGEETNILYPKIKVIDMVMFQYGITHLERKSKKDLIPNNN